MPDAPRFPTFTVLAGPLKGQRLVVDDSVDEVLIGSDADCRLCLDLPGVSPLHARVWIVFRPVLGLVQKPLFARPLIASVRKYSQWSGRFTRVHHAQPSLGVPADTT